jgi:cytochrome c oxidase subunit IV
MDAIRNKNRIAKSAGISYLILAITGIFSFYVESKLIVESSQTTVNNILSYEFLFRLSIVSELVMATSWILIAIFLFALFETVNRTLAFLMAGLVIAGGAIIFIEEINLIAALLVLENATGYLAAFEPEQLNGITMLFLDISKQSMYGNYIFMGLWMFPFAYFVFKSGFFPKTISIIWGILLVIGGLGYIIDFFTYFLFPDLFLNFVAITFVGDLFSIFWLLFKGVKSKDD